MVDVLKIGTSTLVSMQQALSTTGHNIANANTEGYSRQSVEFSSREASRLGFGYAGNGAAIGGIERSYDGFLVEQIRNFSAGQSQYETFLGLSSRLDGLLGGNSGLNQSMQQFFDALQDLSANPAGIPERQVVLGEAGNLVNSQRKLSELLGSMEQEVNAQLRARVEEVNGLADRIATLNREIVSAGAGGHSPNDLLDQRDVLVRDLARKVSVSQVPQPNGGADIYIGNGQGLVVGGEVSHLKTEPNAYDASRLEITLDGVREGSPITAYLSGGELQGLLDFRGRVLEPAQARLGLLTLGLAQNANQVHRAGMDLDGNMGGDLFSRPRLSVLGNKYNSGDAAPLVSVTDAASLQAGDYLLNYDGSQWELSRRAGGAAVQGNASLSLDGLRLDVSGGSPAAGDSFVFNPARDALSGFALATSDPRRLAAAMPVNASAGLDNGGSGQVDGLRVSADNSLPLSAPITLSFNPDALGPGLPGFELSGGPGGSIAYDPATDSGGLELEVPGLGLAFSLSGAPAPGDTFTLQGNQGASGDNRNTLNLAGLRAQPLLEGGKATLQDMYGSLLGRVGVSTRDAESNLAVESALLEQATNQRESVSGVNLDEEAANLLRYQQLYQAAARLVRASDDMFQSLLNAVG